MTMVNKSHMTAMSDEVRNHPHEVRYLKEPMNQSLEGEVKIELFKGARTLGLFVEKRFESRDSSGKQWELGRDGNNSGIFVRKVSEGGLAAELNGRILVGDQLLAVRQYGPDGKDDATFRFDSGNVTEEDAQRLLHKCRGWVALFIRRMESSPLAVLEGECNNQATLSASSWPCMLAGGERDDDDNKEYKNEKMKKEKKQFPVVYKRKRSVKGTFRRKFR